MYHIQARNDSSEHGKVNGSVFRLIVLLPPQLDVPSMTRESFRNATPPAGRDILVDVCESITIECLKADERKGRDLRVIGHYAHGVGGIRDGVGGPSVADGDAKSTM